MATTKQTYADAQAEGTTVWITVHQGSTVSLDALSQAMFDGLAAQVKHFDGLWVESNGNVSLTAEEDMQFHPGGEGNFADFAKDVRYRTDLSEWFRNGPLDIALDFGLEEVRLN